MQTKNSLALFCTIAVLLIGVNDGAPTSPKPGAGKVIADAPTTSKPGAVKVIADAPTASKPGAVKVIADAPTASKPGAVKVIADAPTASKPGAVKVIADASTASKPGAVKVIAEPPTASKPGTVKVETPVVADKPVKHVGGRTAWKTKIDAKSKKLFNDYKKIISKKLQTTHKVAPTFTPKPDKVATQLVSGTLHHYLVKLPTNKYAYVTIHNRAWKKDEYGKEEHVTVRPQLYALNDKNI